MIFKFNIFIILAIFMFVPSVQAEKFDGCSITSNAFQAIQRNNEIYFPHQNLNITNAYNEEGQRLVTFFKVSPRGFFMDEQSPNALATSENISNYPDADGTIIFGTKLMLRELQRDNGIGYSVPAIMAHEFAHILQFKKIRNGEHERPRTRNMELHADFLAGWYLSHRHKFKTTEFDPARNAFEEMGDTDYTSIDHHGTPQERLKAITGGYYSDIGEGDIEEAYNEGWKFVNSL